MSDQWHRLAVYFRLRRKDPDREGRAPTEQPDVWTRAVGFALGTVVLLIPFAIVVAIVRLVAGHSTDPATVLWGSVRLLLAVFGVAALVGGTAAWVRWFAARRHRWLKRPRQRSR